MKTEQTTETLWQRSLFRLRLAENLAPHSRQHRRYHEAVLCELQALSRLDLAKLEKPSASAKPHQSVA